MGENRRPQRVGNEIRNILIGVVDGIRDPRVGLATVTDVVLTPDLKLAKVYVSISGTDREKQEALRALEHACGYIRRELAVELLMRRIPDLQFYLDNTLEEGNRIDQILSELDKKDSE